MVKDNESYTEYGYRGLEEVQKLNKEIQKLKEEVQKLKKDVKFLKGLRHTS